MDDPQMVVVVVKAVVASFPLCSTYFLAMIII